MGFNAIWISPVPEHVEGDYHGYSATDYYSVSHHWGTEQDFHDLVAEAHARDVWIMIDVYVSLVDLLCQMSLMITLLK